MNSLFSKGSLMILESLSFTQTLFAFDFDGTLSKIVRNPSDATMSKSTEMLLEELSQFAPVAIISGRSLADLKKRVHIPLRYLVGNHGLEGLDGSDQDLQEAVLVSKDWKEALSKLDFGSGTEIEDKTYSLAIHYRRSRSKKHTKKLIREAISQLNPAPRILPGKQVVNLLPEGAPHKGLAILKLLKHSGMRQAFYIGDDDTDEDVFGLPEDCVMSARVGEKRNSHARYYIRRQSELNQLLEVLINFYRRKPALNGRDS